MRITTFFLLLASTVLLAAAPPDRPLPPEAAPKAMSVPEGFKVSLFAGEPDVVQPIAFTFDDRGRLWVVECRSYPNWTDKPEGNDRVLIFEDTDGDGRFDKKTVFWDKGANLSGIELGFGGVWLCSIPNLIFISFKDGEDKPSGPPEIVLDGWNLKDTKHNVFNSLSWGPDGWLYGCNGIQSRSRVGKPGTPDKERENFDCGVWRYHPTRKVFEPYAWGTTNPFGLDWDDYGQMFITNCVISHLWHVIPGAHLERMYGEDPNPHVYGYMKSCADHLHWGGGSWTASRSTGVNGKPEHSAAGGGHAHSGCSIYLGDNFPPEYRNSVFMCNLHGNRINRDILERTERGYVGKHGPDFLFANDPWFRGLAVKFGPDGGLYVSDWTDTGECHNYKTVDISNGRIYKTVFGSPIPWSGDISKLADAELVKLQLHHNDWFVRHARRVLQERAAARKLVRGKADALRQIASNNPETPKKLRAIWALHAIDSLTEADLLGLLKDSDRDVRIWGILLASEAARLTAPVADQLLDLAKTEQSPYVRLFLASAVIRLAKSGTLAVPLAAALASHEQPGQENNSNLTLMTWYAIQSVKSDTSELLAECKNPFLRKSIVRYTITREPKERMAQLVQLFKHFNAFRPLVQSDALAGIQEALAGTREFPEPQGWKEIYPVLTKSELPEVRTRSESLAVLFGNEQAIADLKRRMGDIKAPTSSRVAAIELLTRRKVEGLAPALQSLLSDASVRAAAIRALAAFPDMQTPSKLVADYKTFTAAEKVDAIQTLASRPTFAAALLEAIDRGAIPRGDVSVLAARQILALNDKSIAAHLAKTWGLVRPVAKDRDVLMKKWKSVLTTETIKASNKSNGRMLFVTHCASCHKLFGEGAEVGPDLTGSQRATLDYVLENIIDPNAIVPREYQITNFTLADGRVVSGIILRETPDGVSVRTTNDTVAIAKGDIENRKATSQSLMPEGLLDKLKPEEVRDLIAYFGSPMQVPLPTMKK